MLEFFPLLVSPREIRPYTLWPYRALSCGRKRVITVEDAGASENSALQMSHLRAWFRGNLGGKPVHPYLV